MRNRKGRPPIPPRIQLRLWVKSGGRCAFSTCNEYLLRDSLTLNETNYSEIAHIIAFEKGGARGNDPMLRSKRNHISNLMLACRKHHKMIDSKELAHKFPKDLLIRYKHEHESRIYRLTRIKPANKTAVISFKCRIGQDLVTIEEEDIYPAIYPRYPVDSKGIEINLTTLPGVDTKNYWELGQLTIKDTIEGLFRSGINGEVIKHLSVFAFGPIPFLIFLGSCIGSKIPAQVYQKQRPSGWTWQRNGISARYKINTHSQGKDFSKVALILSLSGAVPLNDLPNKILKKYPVYEITLDGQAPHPMHLKTKSDLENFRRVYLSFLRMVKGKNNPKEILVFPAVPISAAIICGMERLKVDPALTIYDFNKKQKRFLATLKVR